MFATSPEATGKGCYSFDMKFPTNSTHIMGFQWSTGFGYSANEFGEMAMKACLELTVNHGSKPG